LKDAFNKSKQARMKILEAMNTVIAEPNKELSQYAPRVKVIKINPDKIGELIGPGGKNIKGIYEKCNNLVDIDIKDEGLVYLTSSSAEMAKLAEEMIAGSVEEAEVGKTYTGVVDKIMPYGAFVDVSSNISGLVHVSEMSDKFVKDPATIIKEGQQVKVKVIRIENGKVSFTMKDVAQS
jgi:polyribonucleotide nucleotidyltransferase